MIDLYDHQLEAIEKMKNGSVLVGGVGTGKSRTALAYYCLKVCKSSLIINGEGVYAPMKNPRDLYIITTAKKRDSHEWIDECGPFCLDLNHVKVDSWNNIKKYKKVTGAFFIFDEQRVVGSGPWVKAFLDICRKNKWILLSATPGDVWLDYIPLFVANGFYKHRTEFIREHVVYSPFTKFRKVEKYVGTKKLERLRKQILVPMDYVRHTVPHHHFVDCEYDKKLYSKVWKDRWDPYKNEPIRETGALFSLIRRVVNSDPSRLHNVYTILTVHSKVIIFYNFNYELDMLRQLLDQMEIPYSEWNGQKHEPILVGSGWVYLVQYTAGAEGWNCITTNAIIFYSLNYSYRATKQAEGRIDRLNTPYTDLYYYHLRSKSPIDIAIGRALSHKRNFNENSFMKKV